MMQKKGGILIAAFIYILCAKTQHKKIIRSWLLLKQSIQRDAAFPFLKNLLLS